MWIISKSHREKCFFLIFLQSIHQVDMKNVVKFSSDFFPYFEALYTNSECPAGVGLLGCPLALELWWSSGNGLFLSYGGQGLAPGIPWVCLYCILIEVASFDAGGRHLRLVVSQFPQQWCLNRCRWERKKLPHVWVLSSTQWYFNIFWVGKPKKQNDWMRAFQECQGQTQAA